MNNYLKHYKMQIEALSPIHIGSGEQAGKKEYIYLENAHKVIIPDIQRMYQALQKRGMGRAYEEYMLKNNYADLGRWLKEKGLLRKDYEGFARYTMDAGEALYDSKRNGDKKTKAIDLFIKDAYGMPYVPGSSIKGMMRSALLAFEIHEHPEQYAKLKEEIQRKAGEYAKRDKCLAFETEDLEVKAFHTLKRKQNNPKDLKDAVNCNLSGLIISDSQPISLEQLTLSQKIDYSLDFQEKPLPILRESLIPGTKIIFEVTIDEQLCPYKIEEIIKALNYYNQISYQCFYSRFKRGNKGENIIWLGGGAGFSSKTILYPMYGKEGYVVIDKVFKNTLGKCYTEHKHTRDLSHKLAPHVCKCTRYKGELYDMGMGRIEILKG